MNKIKIEDRLQESATPPSVETRECGEHTMLQEIYHIEMTKGQRSLRFHFENIVETFEVGIFRHPVLGFGSEFVDKSATQYRLEHGAFVIVPEIFHSISSMEYQT